MLSGLISGEFTALGSRSPEAVKQFLSEQCKARRIEPPSLPRIDRIIRSGLHQGEEHFATTLAAGLTAQAKAKGKFTGRPQTVGKRATEVTALFAQGVSQAEIARRLGMGRTSALDVR